MNKKTSAWIRLISFSILTLALIALLCVGINRSSLGFIGFSFGSSYPDADKYAVGDAEIPADSLKKIEVNWTNGSVNISAYDGNTILIAEKASGALDENDRVRHYYHDGILTIQYRKSQPVFALFANSPEKQLELKIPKKLAAALEETSCETVNSETAIDGLTTKKLSVESVSGNVSFNGCADDIDHETVSGDSHFTCSAAPHALDMESVSGDLTLILPSDACFEADYDSVSGKMACDFPTKNSGDKIVCGNGGGSYDFETVSGDIQIQSSGKSTTDSGTTVVPAHHDSSQHHDRETPHNTSAHHGYTQNFHH